MIGRRREDLPYFDLPDDLARGDYWKCLDRETGEPMQARNAPENLTGTVWGICAPLDDGDGTGYSTGRLELHTVREHDDGTISVRPGDGSSNSILVTGSRNRQWHGYIEHGVWSPC